MVSATGGKFHGSVVQWCTTSLYVVPLHVLGSTRHAMHTSVACCVSDQQIALVLQPGNVWVIETAVEHNEQTDAALKTAYMRGWVEPIGNAVLKGKLDSEGRLPSGQSFQGTGPFWRLTEGGWAAINRTYWWSLFVRFISVLSLALSAASLALSASALH